MHNKRFEAGIRNKLKDYPTAIDTQALKKRIDRQRKTRTDKRRFLAIMLFMFLLIASTMLFMDRKTQPESATANVFNTVELNGSEPAVDSVKLAIVATNKSSLNTSDHAGFEKKARSMMSSPPIHSYRPITKILIPKKSKGLQESIKKQSYSSFDFLSNQENSVENRTDVPLQSVIPQLPSIQPQLLHFAEKVRIPHNVLLNDADSEKTRNTSGRIGFVLSMALPFRSLTSESTDYLALREHSERVLESYGASFLYEIPFSKSWHMSTGLSYQRVNERLFWENSYQDVIQQENQFIAREITRTKIHYNSIQWFELPIKIRYSKPWRNLNFGAQLGIHINLHQSASGEIIAPNIAATEFIPLDNGLFKRRTSPSYSASLYFAKRLAQKITISVEPGFKLQAQSITDTAYELHQKYAFVFLDFGLHWSLN